MPLYSVFGLRLDSDIEFPELTLARADGAAAKFRLGASAPQSARQDWVHEAPREDGMPWLSVGPAEDRRTVRFHGQADFLLSRDTFDVEALPVPGTAVETVRWLFLDHVLPRALAAGGRPVLHASAVETKRGALVFVGESGSGKSTLAASFCEDGARLLSDDGVLVDGSRVVPSYPVHRLWPSGVAVLGKGQAPDPQKKTRMRPEAWDAAPAALHRIFILAEYKPGSPWIEPATGGEAMMALLRQAFRLDPSDAELAAAEFRTLGDLAVTFPPVKLSYPRRGEDLAEVKIKISEFS